MTFCSSTRAIANDGGNRLSADWLNDAAFGNDGFDKAGGSDVEGGIIDADALGRGLAAEPVRNLLAGPLFDRNLLSAFKAQIERRRRSRDVEGNAVSGGQ